MIVTTDYLSTIRSKHSTQKIVLTCGTFDLFHVGHLHYLQAVKAYGDVLVIMLSGDNRVISRKGLDRPIIPESERAEILDALKIVDYVFLDQLNNEPGNMDPIYNKILEDLSPEVFVADGIEPRFAEYKGKQTEMVVQERVAVGQRTSTTEIINYIAKLSKS